MDMNDIQASLTRSMLDMCHIIQILFKKATKDIDITFPQFMLMKNVYCNQQMTIGQIVKHTGLEQGNISHLCKNLEKKGWIQRQRNPLDEREVLVSVTEKGQDLIQHVDGYALQQYQEVFQAMGNDEMNQIVIHTQKLIESFKSVME